MFYARLTELRRVTAFVETYCRDAGVAREPCLKVNVILEELFVNTVRHGHRGDSEAPVWMTLEAGETALQVTYEDTAPPFNPYARLPLMLPDTTGEMRKIGGLGVLLTKALAHRRDYAYVFGRNRIRLALNR
jgi:anti-sigma regulatory factor (Ser/Thr protein kinase)